MTTPEMLNLLASDLERRATAAAQNGLSAECVGVLDMVARAVRLTAERCEEVSEILPPSLDSSVSASDFTNETP